MSEILKPCPFCGGEAYIEEESDARSCIYNVARCKECGVEVVVYVDMTKTIKWNEQRVIEKWNKRHNPWHTGTPTEAGWYLFRYIYKAKEMGNKYFYATERFIEVGKEILNLGDCAGGSQITKIYPLVKKMEWQKIDPNERRKEK